METEISKRSVENLAGTLGYDNAFVVDSDGRSGGLGLFWKNSANVEVFRFSKYHIGARVLGVGDDP
jgi:hypothetical protein